MDHFILKEIKKKICLNVIKCIYGKYYWGFNVHKLQIYKKTRCITPCLFIYFDWTLLKIISEPDSQNFFELYFWTFLFALCIDIFYIVIIL